MTWKHEYIKSCNPFYCTILWLIVAATPRMIHNRFSGVDKTSVLLQVLRLKQIPSNHATRSYECPPSQSGCNRREKTMTSLSYWVFIWLCSKFLCPQSASSSFFLNSAFYPSLHTPYRWLYITNETNPTADQFQACEMIISWHMASQRGVTSHTETQISDEAEVLV